MGELLKRFYELWLGPRAKERDEAARPVYFRGETRVAQAMEALGIDLERPAEGARLEFLSPKRGAWSGAWIEGLPSQGEACQRVFASVFQGLAPGAPFLVLQAAQDPAAGTTANTAHLAWLRQAGFEALTEAASADRHAILCRRI